MYWLQLTQANTGAKLYVNMEQVIVIAPSQTGGANLVLPVSETAQKTGRQAARILPVRETQEMIVDMMSRGAEA
ncbi:MAG: hypothetical protein ACREE4_20545 [Stellaceae bacterium]